MHGGKANTVGANSSTGHSTRSERWTSAIETHHEQDRMYVCKKGEIKNANDFLL